MEKSSAMLHDKNRSTGFTMIEVIAVLIILAIISAVAVSRVGSNESSLRAEVNDLKAALRYAQQMAIASDSTVGFRITVTPNDYTIYRVVGGVETIPHPLLPGESASSHSFSGVSASSATFTFNEWGGIGSDTAVTLTGGGGSKTINVIGETGYAYEL